MPRAGGATPALWAPPAYAIPRALGRSPSDDRGKGVRATDRGDVEGTPGAPVSSDAFPELTTGV